MKLEERKLVLISKIMESYDPSNIEKEEKLGVRFNKLYEMDADKLQHLANIRGIKQENEMKI